MADLLIKEDIVLGNRVEVIALCSKVEVKQNLTAVGSFREIYHLSGKEGSFVSGIIFKNNNAERVDVELFEDAPVLVKGVIGEYNDMLQIHIESIGPLTQHIDKNDLLAEMVDTRVLDDLNDILWSLKSMYTLSYQHLKPSKGLDDVGAGTMAFRLLKFLQIGLVHYPEKVAEYASCISILIDLYMNTVFTLDDRFSAVKTNDTPMMRVLLGFADYPEYEEFVKLHHLIMKPKGWSIEILGDNTNNYSFNRRNS